VATKFREALREAIAALAFRQYLLSDELQIFMNKQMNAYLLNEDRHPADEWCGSIWGYTILEEETGHAAVVRSFDGRVSAEVDWEPQPTVGLHRYQIAPLHGGTLTAWNFENDHRLIDTLRNQPLQTPIYRHVREQDVLSEDARQAMDWWTERYRSLVRPEPTPPAPNEWVPSVWGEPIWTDAVVDLRDHFRRIVRESIENSILNDPPHLPNEVVIHTGDITLDATLSGRSVQPMEEEEKGDADS
jgi:hypothetical protein